MRTRAFVLAGVAALVAAKAFAQARPTFEIAPFIGYRFGGSVGDTFSAATYGIDGAASAGVTVSVSVGKTTAIELLFSRQDTGVDVAAYPSTQHHALTIDHLMAGAVGEFPGHGGRVHPFMEAYLGLTRIQSRDANGGYSTYGLDCSGFVKAVFASNGINLPRVAREQALVGMPVGWSQLQSGDRLYFACKGGQIDHAGIYMGNGFFIHSSMSRGGVAVDSVLKPFYMNSLVAARR